MGAAADQARLAQAVHNPGRLVLGPTSTTGTFPYGGVSLGFHRDAEAVWHAEYIQVRDPGSGRISEQGRAGCEYPEIYCLIEGNNWDEDAVRALFTQSSVAALLPYPSPAETRIETTTVPVVVQAWPPLLMVADDPTHKSWYVRRPIPTLSLRQGIAISQSIHSGLPVRFIPSPTASTIPDTQVARLENIQL